MPVRKKNFVWASLLALCFTVSLLTHYVQFFEMLLYNNRNLISQSREESNIFWPTSNVIISYAEFWARICSAFRRRISSEIMWQSVLEEKDFPDQSLLRIKRVRFPSKVYDTIEDFTSYLDRELLNQTNLLTLSWDKITMESEDMLVLTNCQSKKKKATCQKCALLGYLSLTSLSVDFQHLFGPAPAIKP